MILIQALAYALSLFLMVYVFSAAMVGMFNVANLHIAPAFVQTSDLIEASTGLHPIVTMSIITLILLYLLVKYIKHVENSRYKFKVESLSKHQLEQYITKLHPATGETIESFDGGQNWSFKS